MIASSFVRRTYLGVLCVLQKAIKQFSQEDRIFCSQSSTTDLVFQACCKPQAYPCRYSRRRLQLDVLLQKWICEERNQLAGWLDPVKPLHKSLNTIDTLQCYGALHRVSIRIGIWNADILPQWHDKCEHRAVSML